MAAVGQPPIRRPMKHPRSAADDGETAVLVAPPPTASEPERQGRPGSQAAPSRSSSALSAAPTSTAALDGALKEREADPADGQLSAAMQRIGELSMEVELLRARIERPGPLGRRTSR